MKEKVFRYDFVGPLILKILHESNGSMTTLAINYMINQSVGRTVNLKIIKDHLTSLVKDEKISKRVDEGNSVVYYDILPKK